MANVPQTEKNKRSLAASLASQCHFYHKTNDNGDITEIAITSNDENLMFAVYDALWGLDIDCSKLNAKEVKVKGEFVDHILALPIENKHIKNLQRVAGIKVEKSFTQDL